jgi:hypothetical protein
VNYYFVVVEQLMFDLSIWRCSPELKAAAKRLAAKNQVCFGFSFFWGGISSF